MSFTLGQIKSAETIVTASLQFFKGNEEAQNDYAADFVKASEDTNLALGKMQSLATAALSMPIDADDRKRLSNGLNTRGLKPLTVKYASNAQLTSTLSGYAKWSATLGFEPPHFNDGVLGGTLFYLREGSLTNLKNVMRSLTINDYQKKQASFQLADAVKSAAEYKQILQEQLAKVQTASIIAQAQTRTFSGGRDVTTLSTNDEVKAFVTSLAATDPTIDQALLDKILNTPLNDITKYAVAGDVMATVEK